MKNVKTHVWFSLKKTRADLNALRSKGYKIILWHGESDTLYKLKILARIK